MTDTNYTTVPLPPEAFEELKQHDVMSREVTEDEYAIRADMLENSRLNLKLPNHIFDSLDRTAQLKGKTIEEYATDLLKESLITKVGAAFISSPSSMNGNIAKKVKGPSNLGMIQRA